MFIVQIIALILQIPGEPKTDDLKPICHIEGPDYDTGACFALNLAKFIKYPTPYCRGISFQDLTCKVWRPIK